MESGNFVGFIDIRRQICYNDFNFRRGGYEMAVNLKTKDLTLRPFAQGDRQTMGAILTNSQVRKTYMIPELKTQEAIDRMFGRFMELSLAEDRYVAGICLDGRVIGFLNDVTKDAERIELGYVIDPAYHGKGYATQALKAAVEDLFSRGYREVVAGAFEENPASIRVMIKAGMTRCPEEEDIEYLGTIHHCIYYSIKQQ